MAKYTLPDLPYTRRRAAAAPLGRDARTASRQAPRRLREGRQRDRSTAADAETWQVAGLERALAFNVSGHGLHSLFWESMSPEMEQQPSGNLAAAIDSAFGSFDKYLERFKARAHHDPRFGLGAADVGADRQDSRSCRCRTTMARC